MKKLILLSLIMVIGCIANSQTTITIYPDTLQGLLPVTAKPGVFYVPKTSVAETDFNSNGIYQNAIRTHVIESALNNAENLDECLSIIESVSADLQLLSEKCQKFVFIFEKMPAWLSSSSDGSPASTPGWFVLNTKPPADWEAWELVVSEITNLLVNEIGIENAWFEIWNEPDLGSWTASEAEYYELYKRSFDAIKAVDNTLAVGGPAVNFWANDIYWQPPAGKISMAQADSSLIGQLLEYSADNDCNPDFLSWHNFNLFDQEFKEAVDYIKLKCDDLSIETPTLMVSEWNAPSAVRESSLHKAFIVKGQESIIRESSIDNQIIAAWHDFEEGASEFHSDYGMLSWGGIHKPAYYATLMMNELKGTLCKAESDDPIVLTATAYEDSMYILLANYCPTPIVAALGHTFYQGDFNAIDLDNAGFINLETGDLSYLESIYSGDVIIGDDSPLHIAINESIPSYSFYEFYQENPRTFNLNLEGYSDDYTAVIYELNDTINNNRFKFDSLVNMGYTREEAADYLRENQGLKSESFSFTSGETSLNLAPNAIVLIKIGVDGVGGIINETENLGFKAYPNPTNSTLTISGFKAQNELELRDFTGKVIRTFNIEAGDSEIDISELKSGIYLLGNPKNNISFKKIIKN
ncbi:MAG: T9SS type A sorting domain-containing protein [Flavobacteriales bacterium]|nr:T9SS type A sorting domain-containing protein [Flavobacteriales bacterium]